MLKPKPNANKQANKESEKTSSIQMIITRRRDLTRTAFQLSLVHFQEKPKHHADKLKQKVKLHEKKGKEEEKRIKKIRLRGMEITV